MKQSRCANCTILVNRPNKAALFDQQEVLHLLRKWHPKRMVEDTDIICMVCLTLIKNAMESGNTDTPIQGKRHPCPACGKALINRHCKVSFKKISLDNEKEARIHNVIAEWILPEEIEPTAQICYGCWLKASRYLTRCAREEQKEQEEEAQNTTDETAPDPDIPETIILPNYKRTVATECSQCIFANCKETIIIEIPMTVRRKLLVKYGYYLLPSCRIFKNHLDGDFWETVVSSGVKTFTAEHIEEMIEVLKSDNKT